MYLRIIDGVAVGAGDPWAAKSRIDLMSDAEDIVEFSDGFRSDLNYWRSTCAAGSRYSFWDPACAPVRNLSRVSLLMEPVISILKGLFGVGIDGIGCLYACVYLNCHVSVLSHDSMFSTHTASHSFHAFARSAWISIAWLNHFLMS